MGRVQIYGNTAIVLQLKIYFIFKILSVFLGVYFNFLPHLTNSKSLEADSAANFQLFEYLMILVDSPEIFILRYVSKEAIK